MIQEQVLDVIFAQTCFRKIMNNKKDNNIRFLEIAENIIQKCEEQIKNLEEIVRMRKNENLKNKQTHIDNKHKKLRK